MQFSFRPAASAIAVGAALAAAALLPAPPAKAADGAPIVVDFEGFAHGQKLGSAYGKTASSQVDIKVANNDPIAPDVPVIFDTRKRNTSDPDLEAPFPTGNLRGQTLGNILIIPENNVDANKDGILDDPDDLGSRPSGQFRLTFTGSKMTSFGLDMVDIEQVEIPKSLAYIIFQRRLSTNTYQEITRVPFVNFVTPGNKYYDPTIVFGDHSANRIKPITAASLGSGVTTFDRVIVNLDGSGAIDNLRFTPFVVPEPATGLALLAGAAVLLPRRRRA
jgi:hypothetical protein